MRVNGSTIPYSKRNLGATFYEGRFVQRSDTKITLSVGNVGEYLEGEYSIAQGGESDGVAWLPRPEVRDSANNVVIPGDKVLVTFIEGSSRRPVVLSGVRYSENPTLPRNYQEMRYAGHNINRVAMQRKIYDASGNVVGVVQCDVGTAGEPSVILGANGSVTINVGAKLDDPTTVLGLDEDSANVATTTANVVADTTNLIGKTYSKSTTTSPTSPVLLDGLASGFQASLATSLAEIAALLAVFGLPATYTTGTLAPQLSASAWSSSQLEAE